MRKHKHAIWIVGMLLAFAMLMQQGTMGKVHAEDWKNNPEITFSQNGEIKIQIQKTTIVGDDYLPGAKLELTCVNKDNQEVSFSTYRGEPDNDVNGSLKSAMLDVGEEGELLYGPGPTSDYFSYFSYLSWLTGNADATVTFKFSKVLWDKLSGDPDEYIEFTLSETAAPKGYETADPITFKFRINGDKLEWQGLEHNGQGSDPTFKVMMIDEVADSDPVKPDPITIKINKTDITGAEELAGAHLQILDQNGNVVKIDGKDLEWTSVKGQKWEVTGLTAGNKYTLRETVAPDGYAISTDTIFVLKSDGTIDSAQTTTAIKDGVLLVKDSLTSVKISKVDINGDVELEGATLQILDETGGVKQEWVSGKTPHEVKGLTTGKKYTLRETVAPTGYKISTDTTFVLKADGTIDTEKTTTTVKNGVLLVEDTKLEEPGNGDEKPEEKPEEKPAEQKPTEKKTTAVAVESTQSPKTGDSTNLWMNMLLMSLFTGTNFFLCVKRKRER